MRKKIIKIDENRCNGCGKCATACHEGAIEMIDGKARLTREDYCDGLGSCLPACPTDAISFEIKEMHAEKDSTAEHVGSGACLESTLPDRLQIYSRADSPPSRLMQWPCQIRLVPTAAPYFDGADILISADCCAYAYGEFHRDLMRGRVTLIGCPKLDGVDYAQRLSEIISLNSIRSIRLARMEVPCCSGLEVAVKRAIAASGKHIPLEVISVSTDGKILD